MNVVPLRPLVNTVNSVNTINTVERGAASRSNDWWRTSSLARWFADPLVREIDRKLHVAPVRARGRQHAAHPRQRPGQVDGRRPRRAEQTDDAALADVVRDALTAPIYSLDTEFHRERTYFPRLALVQLQWGNNNVLIDPLAVDPRGLGAFVSGQIIGIATAPIAAGDHIHTHNLGMIAQEFGHTARIIHRALGAHSHRFQ